jgi:hypothetical protein
VDWLLDENIPIKESTLNESNLWRILDWIGPLQVTAFQEPVLFCAPKDLRD